ncbi:MAG: HmuY family protein [Gemmatimonadales bacterium]
MSSPPPGPWRATVTLWVLLGAFVFLLASIVVGALRHPAIPSGIVTPPHPIAVGDTLVGPSEVTLDASAPDSWTFFDFSRNSAVVHPGPLDWDLAVRRFYIIANGGPGFAGQGGIRNLGRVALDSVAEVPEGGYEPTGGDSVNGAIRHWYDYSWTSHLLRTDGHAYAVRTADGKYAKLAVVSYYCGEAKPGCLTLRYAYQGDGSRRMRR